MNRKDKVWIKLMNIGHWLGCHQMESRSFSFKGYQFPLCARCTGVLIGNIIGIIDLCIGIRIEWYWTVLFIGIMGADWFIQYLEILYSNNYRRLVTGTLCGVGVTYCYFYAICIVARLIKDLIL